MDYNVIVNAMAHSHRVTLRQHFQVQVDDLNNRIAPLAASVISLKREMNRLLPVGRIPTEMLSQVFLALQKEYRRDQDDDNVGYHPIPWAAVMQVCHSWHQVAVNDPNLWCHIRFRFGDEQTEELHTLPRNEYWPAKKSSLIKEMLRRSKELPLTIKIRGRPAMRMIGSDTLEPLLNHRHRIKVLSCKRFHPKFRNTYPEFFDGSFPNLQVFRLKADSVIAEMPPIFLTSKLPKLRRISTRGIPFPAIAGLIQPPIADVRFFHFDLTNDPSLFLTILESLDIASSSLKVLQLNLPTSLIPPPITITKRVNLPQLEDIEMSCSLTQTASLLDHIFIPRDAHMNFRISSSEPNPLDLEGIKVFAQQVTDYLKRYPPNPSKTLEILTIRDQEATVWLIAGSKLHVEIIMPNTTRFELVKILCSTLPLTGVYKLTFDDLEFPGVPELISLFGGFKDVESVVVEGASRSLFLQALAESCSSKDTVLFPKLRAVSLQHGPDFHLLVGRDDIKAFEPWLKRRVDAGYPLHSLEFTGADDLEDEDFEELGDLLEDLSVN